VRPFSSLSPGELLLGGATGLLLFGTAAFGGLTVTFPGTPAIRIDPKVALALPTRAATPTSALLPAVSPAKPAEPAKVAVPSPTTASSTVSASAAPPVPVEGDAARAAIRSVVRIETDDGLGTGFLTVLGSERLVVTNAHVVEGASTVRLIRPDGAERRATVRFRDEEMDLASVAAEGLGDLPVLRLGNSGGMRVGDPLYVVGFAAGSRLLGDPTVSRGILSSRRVLRGNDFLQTDAAMNSGNSGGPVLNSAGEVVGVATLVLVDQHGQREPGLNFALPASTVFSTLGRGATAVTESAPTPVPASGPESASWPVLRGGASGDVVRTAQYLLRHHGQDVLVDGDFGPETQGAVRAFQRSRQMVADGEIGPLTWSALAVTLKQGSKGDAVRAVQSLLRRRYDIVVDGDFGPQTDVAVRAFQRSRGLTVDGVVGNAETWPRLVADR
jgi:serine protease Do